MVSSAHGPRIPSSFRGLWSTNSGVSGVHIPAPTTNPSTISPPHGLGGSLLLGTPNLQPSPKIATGPAIPPGSKLLAANDLNGYYARIDALKSQPSLTVTKLGSVKGHPIHSIHLPATKPGAMKVVITAGVHGNEPCSTAAAMLLIDQLLARPDLRKNIDVTVVPNINPRGYKHDSRRTPEDVDLNRVFFAEDAPEEIKIVRDHLKSRKATLALDLHSGKSTRNGFWVLHRESLDIMQPAFQRFGARWPLLSGDTKPYTMTSPGVGTSKNKSTLKDFMKDNGARWSATLEAPGSLPYNEMTLGQNEMVREIIGEALRKVKKPKPRMLVG